MLISTYRLGIYPVVKGERKVHLNAYFSHTQHFDTQKLAQIQFVNTAL